MLLVAVLAIAIIVTFIAGYYIGRHSRREEDYINGVLDATKSLIKMTDE